MGEHAIKRPAVFLDRDGTIIKFLDVVSDPAHVELLPGAGAAIAELNTQGFLVIEITNQPNIEKGLFTLEQNGAIEAKLQKDLAAFNAHIDAAYVCPHMYRSPSDATPQCLCRKPGTKLIEDAQKDFFIDMERSWFAGDRLRDVATGQRAHFRTILIRAIGQPDNDDQFFPGITPDYQVTDLAAAAKLITNAQS